MLFQEGQLERLTPNNSNTMARYIQTSTPIPTIRKDIEQKKNRYVYIEFDVIHLLKFYL